ncbi:hypothetical protein KKF34_01865 [Myxococcota bacterium]|nr:hypothetical protein [Myxococcota bacterium]MBU1382762.1 hypothetical protein [Myxococcota bacterium]MBU1495606.1 hypothetical protein [Myxococcota bacterium]
MKTRFFFIVIVVFAVSACSGKGKCETTPADNNVKEKPSPEKPIEKDKQTPEKTPEKDKSTVTPVSDNKKPSSPLDCSKPLEVVSCCDAITDGCDQCRAEWQKLKKGWDLKCKVKVVREYTACGCGCCGGLKNNKPPACLYFRNGDDIREIIKRDKTGTSPEECATVGCSFGKKYKYCD